MSKPRAIESYILVCADSPEEAIKKVSEAHDHSTDPQTEGEVTTQGIFAGFTMLSYLYEKLEDMAEILWFETRNARGVKNYENKVRSIELLLTEADRRYLKP